MKVLLICNTSAGKGKGGGKISQLIRILEQKGFQTETFFTKGPGDAKSRAARIAPDVQRLIVAGGDGTLNEVLNGLPDPSRIPIALVPSGTSNVMAKETALPNKPHSIAVMLEQGAVRRLDMGTIGDRRFLLFVSVGLDAMVMKELLQCRSSRLGYRRYIMPVMKALARYHPPDLGITIDESMKLKGGMVLVGNTRHYGGILSITDKARYDSGHLDVCIVPKATIPSLARYYLAAARGRVSQERKIHYLTGKRIRIDSEEPVAVQVDGDYFGTTPVLINISASVVPLLVPCSNQ